MRIKSIDKVPVGSVLYGDVIDNNNKLILAKGNIVTKDRIKLLKLVGVRSVSICTQEKEVQSFSASLRSRKKIISDVIFADSYTELVVNRNELDYMQEDTILTRHNKNVASLMAMCINDNELSLEHRKSVVQGAVLHDIGKLGVPRRILDKRGRLTPEEYDYIKLHPVLGVGYLMHVQQHASNTEIRMVEQHHENYDGSGYPYGLAMGDIDKDAALLHIIDVFEARCAKRAYKHPEDRSVILNDMEQCVGRMFDPDAFDIFRKSIPLYFVGERIVADDNYIYIVVGHTSNLEPILHNVVEDSDYLLSEVSKHHKCYVDDLYINGVTEYDSLKPNGMP